MPVANPIVSRPRLLIIVALIVLIAAVAGGRWLGSFVFAQIDPDEEVAFYGSYLHWDADGELKLVLRGRLYEPEKTSLRRRAAIDRVIAPSLFRYIGKKASDFDDDSRELMYERLHTFLYDGESRVAIKVRVRGQGGEVTIELPKTGAGGYFAATIDATGAQTLAELVGTGRELHVSAVLPAKDKRRFDVRLPVPPRRVPLLVVSDVDDTIRIAEVTNRPRMIERVFLRPYEPVPGLGPIYEQLERDGAWIHYVSGSPWQLEPVIKQFLADAKFPAGVLHCRQLNWDFWNGDPLDMKEYKVGTIQTLLEQFPSGKVLMIGDSGEFDPEVYSVIASKHPDRVAGIWIRKVGDTWTPERLAEAKRLVGAERVMAFGEEKELKPAVEKMATELRRETR